MQFNTKQFAKDIKTKRTIDNNLSLRQLSELLTTKTSSISAATISRVENENLPDIVTAAILCKWLGKTITIDSYLDSPAKVDKMFPKQ